MHNWHWRTWQGHPYLTCSLLSPWLHGFFSRLSWPQTPDALVSVFNSQSNSQAQVYRVAQVHGDRVLTPAEAIQATQGQERPQADALVSETPHQSVWVCSADCNPVLVADKRLGQVAAIHAGWRGTALKVAPATIARLQSQGSRLEDVLVAMGPAIAGNIYQVSTQVGARVGSTVSNRHFQDDADLVSYLLEQTDPVLLKDTEPGRVRLDVRRVNALQLEKIGLHPDQIAIAPYCTYQDPERFFSYRRSKEKKVQWSGIVSR